MPLVAVPVVPPPGPVAVKATPTVLELAPIKVKSVSPTLTIVYFTPVTKLPVVTVSVSSFISSVSSLVLYMAHCTVSMGLFEVSTTVTDRSTVEAGV